MKDYPMKEYRCAHTGEQCWQIDHPSGLPIFVYPKPGYRSRYAVYAVRYGSLDVRARETDGTVTELPAGIAHYLEHKLFDGENGSAFDRYAATGASANAYTSFDHTAYLFTTTGALEEPLEVLLDFVQSPYFTAETVEKERGIIGQEIRMGEDTPSRRVLFNLLRALYRQHPVKTDIAGTVESIAAITPELLYACYRSYYQPRNMVLAVAGDVTVEQVLAVADRCLPAEPPEASPLERALPEEPPTPAQPLVEEYMAVAAPLFYVGYKDALPAEALCTPQHMAAIRVLLELLAGKMSPLYTALLEQGLINSSFSADYFEGPGYGTWMFGGESADPHAVQTALRAEIERLRRDGIVPADFEASRKRLYGRLVAQYNDVENCADEMVRAQFYERKPYELLDAAACLDIQSVYACLQDSLRTEQEALSVVYPQTARPTRE